MFRADTTMTADDEAEEAIVVDADDEQGSSTEPILVTARTAGMPRLKVLISAFAASPIGGSEPGVGWHFASHIAKWHDVTLMCCPGMPAERNFRTEISDLLERNPIPGLTIEFVDPPLLSRLLQREDLWRRRTVYYVGYRAWQKAAFDRARLLSKHTSFDVVHHLNITGFREPGDLWRLDIPFVWGPLVGAANLDWPYLGMMNVQERLFYAVRNVTNGLQKRLLRLPKAAARRARHIWAVSADDAEMVGRFWGRSAECLIENGAQPVWGTTRRFDGKRPLRLLWNGIHVGRKALPILLHAVHRLKDRDRIALTVLGTGPATTQWQALATRLGVDQCVTWTGAIPHEEALRHLENTDVLVHTSVLDGTAAVVLEALSACVPVICHDICGIGTAVDDTCGHKLPLSTPEGSIESFRLAIERMLDEPDRVRRLSEGAAARATELSWDGLALRIARRYLVVAKHQPPRLQSECATVAPANVPR